MTDREIMDYQRRKISQLKEENRSLKERLRIVTEEQRAIADIDALARIVSASRRPETIGVIVPI